MTSDGRSATDAADAVYSLLAKRSTHSYRQANLLKSFLLQVYAVIVHRSSSTPSVAPTQNAEYMHAPSQMGRSRFKCSLVTMSSLDCVELEPLNHHLTQVASRRNITACASPPLTFNAPPCHWKHPLNGLVIQYGIIWSQGPYITVLLPFSSCPWPCQFF
jgi:hypothetical protein